MKLLMVATFLAAVVGASFAGVKLAGAVPASDPAYVPHAYACVNKLFGTIRIAIPPAPTCSQYTERTLLIASEEKVDNVARSYVKENNSGNATTANYADTSVTCDSGDVATGGGAWLDIGTPGNTNAGDNVALQASYPQAGGTNVTSGEVNGWRAFARELQNIPADISPSASSHTPVQGYYGGQMTWGNFSGGEATYTSATGSAWTLHVYVICRGDVT